MIDFENIENCILDGRDGGNESDIESDYEKAMNDVDIAKTLIESLPVFEDTGERFVHEAVDVWGAFESAFGSTVPTSGIVMQGDMLFNGEKWSLFDEYYNASTYQFYSTEAAAEAAMKGGE